MLLRLRKMDQTLLGVSSQTLLRDVQTLLDQIKHDMTQVLKRCMSQVIYAA